MKLLYLYSKLWSKLSLKKLIFENKRGIEKKRMEEINEESLHGKWILDKHTGFLGVEMDFEFLFSQINLDGYKPK